MRATAGAIAAADPAIDTSEDTSIDTGEDTGADTGEDTGEVVEGDITLTIDLAPRFAAEDLGQLAAQLWFVDFNSGPGEAFAGSRITGEVTSFDVPDPELSNLTSQRTILASTSASS